MTMSFHSLKIAALKTLVIYCNKCLPLSQQLVFLALFFSTFSIGTIHRGGLFLLFNLVVLDPNSRLALSQRKGIAGQYSVSGFL